MKNYIKLAVVALFAVATTLSAQQSTTLSNEMPETWKPDFSNAHVRKAVKVEKQQYTPAEFSKGRSYNVVNTEQRVNTPTSTTLQNNANGNYYRSYGVNHEGAGNVVYNAPTQVEPVAVAAAEATPFGETVVIGDRMNALDRNEKPTDPAVPLGDALIPMLIFALVWTMIRNKE